MGRRKLVVIMVGLPARGKTFLSLRLRRYLQWQGYRAEIYNVGSYRRRLIGSESSKSEFFNPLVSEFAREREAIAKKCFNDAARWLKADGDVAIYDATNVTSARRSFLSEQSEKSGFDHIFVENICDDPQILEKIVDVKVGNSEDYKDKDADEARLDFRERIAHYKRVYETLGEDSPYIKIFNFGEKVRNSYALDNELIDEISQYLGSINLGEKNIYITRHGQTFFNAEDRIGGDSSLTEKGVEYAKRLGDYFRGRDLVVFTSTKKRTIETARFLDCETIHLEELDEINSGICDGMTYEEIARTYPGIHSGRNRDKFNFRYPGGESYRDLIGRVKKAVVRIEAERKDVLVVAHRAVNRCLLSYFIEMPHSEIPYLEMPLNRIIRVYQQKALYGCESLSA